MEELIRYFEIKILSCICRITVFLISAKHRGNIFILVSNKEIIIVQLLIFMDFPIYMYLEFILYFHPLNSLYVKRTFKRNLLGFLFMKKIKYINCIHEFEGPKQI